MELLARTCNYEVMNSERIAARLFLGMGGLAWVVITVGSAFVYPSTVGLARFYPALLVFALVVVAFLTGLFYENLAAAMLFAGAAATIVWGSLTGWEIGVWGLMSFFLIAPEIVAGLLFLMAAQMQRVCEIASEA